MRSDSIDEGEQSTYTIDTDTFTLILILESFTSGQADGIFRPLFLACFNEHSYLHGLNRYS
jgi:hypothetical protein